MGERIQFETNGHQTEGYLARPAAPGPGVIVIQEWWGLVPHIEQVADRFAAAGFVALAPDLYHGARATSPDEAGKLMMSLRVDQAAADLDGAVRVLQRQPETLSGQVGTIGFCMGGALSLFAASRNPHVGACVVFYGIHPNISPDLPALAAPVLGIYAEQDALVTASAIGALDAQLSALGKRHTFHTYPGTRHAFFNDTRPEVYDESAATDAWQKTLAFLREELPRGAGRPA
ncbi:MAG: dienelactone hydrolase family protein [Vicinamibacterales bacterium]